MTRDDALALVIAAARAQAETLECDDARTLWEQTEANELWRAIETLGGETRPC